MENTVGFAVRDNNNFYKIDISRTLLHFAEFDFTFFWEQCIEAGKTARKTGRLPQNIVANAKSSISSAHPYIEACIATDYSEIVTDCIIEYICHSERIGLEELWARCITPKNMYETAIFRRVSEYKTNRAMNRWTSVVRLQEYARNKTEFIFGPEKGKTELNDEMIRVRKEYFDLALSVAANELGCPPDALPSVRLCNTATVPSAAFSAGKAAKAIYRRFSEALAHGQDMSSLENKSHYATKDQTAMEAYSFVKNMNRPSEIDMKFALEALNNNPSELFLPDSLKAALDLEFDLMCSRRIYMRKCESCGKYFIIDDIADDDPRCNRVNSSGKTCRRQYEELCEEIAVKARESAEAASEAQVYTVPQDMEKRGQKLYNALYKRVGKGIDENEFREWSQYLSNMKRNIKIGEAAVSQLEEFLDYSDKLCEEVKLASKSRSAQSAPAAEQHAQTEDQESSGNSVNAEYKEMVTLPEKQEPVVHSVIKSTDVMSTSGNIDIKPFVPQTFDSLYDAFMAGQSEDQGKGSIAPEKREKKQVEIKLPQWERLTREDAYGKKD